MQKSLKWSPTQPLKRPDNIISSKARETGDIGFTPAYLSEPKEDMKFIMSNEYMRLWFHERGKYEKDTYSKVQIIREESRIRRRYVQRMMTYKKPDKNEFIEQKIQEHRAPKGDATKNQPVDYSRYKYKPVCRKKMAEKASNQTNNLIGGTSNKNGNSISKDLVNGSDENDQAIVFCPVDNICVPCCTHHCAQ